MADEPVLITVGPESDTLTASSHDVLNRFVGGRYELRRSLGRGASKEVFLARDMRLDRDVAIALIKRAPSAGGLPARVLQEVRTTARLDEHPHIVTVYDVIEEHDATWIVSQLVRGGTVEQLLEAHPHGLPIADAVRIAGEVASALHFAHEHGVIHRDVKPSNVLLVPPDNIALLADFGVAFLPDQPRLTVNGMPVGTPTYMSPEQAYGEVADRRSDLYTLGAMLYELVCGRPPFSATTVPLLLAKHVHELAADPSTINPAVPPALAGLILQLLSKRPEDRPSSAAAVCEALGTLLLAAPATGEQAAPESLPLPGPLMTDPERVFVGRKTAMGDLRDAWLRAEAGPPQLVLMTGDAGIGKTSLAAAFAGDVQQQGAAVLYGRCDEDPLVSYQPFVEALRHLIRFRPRVVAELQTGWTAELTELAKLIPELRRHATVAGAPRQETHDLERYQLFETMLALLSSGRTRQSLLLVLDDMQWADEPTELLLRHLMRAPLSGVMVLVTRRPPKARERDSLARVAEDLKRDASGHRRLVRLTITGLDAEETYELASTRRDQQIDKKFGLLLRAETAGHPFFIDQVLRELGDADLSTGARAAKALHDLAVPEEVEEFIEDRLDSFRPGAEELLMQAGVCGAEFRLDVLSELSGDSVKRVIDLLADPIAAGLVVELNPGGYAFSHALVRETLYALYERRGGKTERARLHLRLGEMLVRSGTAAAAELALHFHAAREVGGAAQAIEHAKAAAKDAESALAYEEAAVFMREACEALECQGRAGDAERCNLLQSAGRLRWQAGDQRGAQGEFLAAATLARELGDKIQLARAALGYAGRSYDAEAIDPVLRRLFEEALETVPAHETSLRAKLLARFAEALSPVDGDRAIALTDQALNILHGAPDDDALTTAVAARHMALLHIDHHAERCEVGRRWVEMAAARHRQSVGTALTWRVYDLIERGDQSDLDAAGQVRERLSRLAGDLQQPLFSHFAAGLEAKWLLMEGRFAEAEVKAQEAYAHGIRAQGTHVALLLAGQRFGLSRDQGRLADLSRDVSPFLDPEAATLPAWRATLILAHHFGGETERARSELRDMVAHDLAGVHRDMFWLGIVCLLAESAAELDAPEIAAAIIPRLEPYAGYNAQIGLSIVLGPVPAFLARLAVVLRDGAAAQRHFELALRRAAIAGAQPTEARLQYHHGEFLLSTGRDAARSQALDLLQSARTSARQLGMKGIEVRAREALERALPGTDSAQARGSPS
jgi:eukaryotic-like serine/threonine-protein kinase